MKRGLAPKESLIMDAIENEYLTDINPAILKEQVHACRRLWMMVIIYALRDARDRIANTKSKYLNEAVDKEMKYFNSPDFEEICNRAGIAIGLTEIEDGLRKLRWWNLHMTTTRTSNE